MKKTSKKKAKAEKKDIAKERLGILFGLADDAASAGGLEKADYCIGQARKIAMRFNLRIPRKYKSRYCKHCYRYLLPGKTSQVRLDPEKHRVAVKCLACGKYMFHPYVKERKDERKNAHLPDRKTRHNRERLRRDKEAA